MVISLHTLSLHATAIILQMGVELLIDELTAVALRTADLMTALKAVLHAILPVHCPQQLLRLQLLAAVTAMPDCYWLLLATASADSPMTCGQFEGQESLTTATLVWKLAA